MFILTKGYLSKIFQSVSLFEASAQINSRSITDKAIIKQSDLKLLVCKITQVFEINSEIRRFVLTDSVNEAYIFVDSETLNEVDEEEIQVGSVIIVKNYAIMELSVAVQIYGGQESHFCLNTDLTPSNLNRICVFLKDFQIIGLDADVSSNNLVDQCLSTMFTIMDLNSDMKCSSWTINALLTEMTELKYYISANGKSCCYVRVQFSDNTGTIELVAFNQLAKIKMVQDLTKNTIYRIAFGDIKKAKSTCSAWESSNSSIYEIMLTKDTQIQQLTGDQSRFMPVQTTSIEVDSKVLNFFKPVFRHSF